MKRTFAQSRSEILNYLKLNGWTVKENLKVPWAETSRVFINETVMFRLWFKTQAVYLGFNHHMTDARSTWIDIREVTPEQFVEQVLQQVVMQTSAYKQKLIDRHAIVPITLKIYCECGEDYKLASGEKIKCKCGRNVSRI